MRLRGSARCWPSMRRRAEFAGDMSPVFRPIERRRRWAIACTSASEQPALHCLDAATGIEQWEARTASRNLRQRANRTCTASISTARSPSADAATGAVSGRLRFRRNDDGVCERQDRSPVFDYRQSGLVQCLHEIGAKKPPHYATGAGRSGGESRKRKADTHGSAQPADKPETPPAEKPARAAEARIGESIRGARSRGWRKSVRRCCSSRCPGHSVSEAGGTCGSAERRQSVWIVDRSQRFVVTQRRQKSRCVDLFASLALCVFARELACAPPIDASAKRRADEVRETSSALAGGRTFGTRFRGLTAARLTVGWLGQAAESAPVRMKAGHSSAGTIACDRRGVLRTRLRSAQATVPLFYRRDVNAHAVPVVVQHVRKIFATSSCD